MKKRIESVTSFSENVKTKIDLFQRKAHEKED